MNSDSISEIVFETKLGLVTISAEGNQVWRWNDETRCRTVVAFRQDVDRDGITDFVMRHSSFIGDAFRKDTEWAFGRKYAETFDLDKLAKTNGISVVSGKSGEILWTKSSPTDGNWPTLVKWNGQTNILALAQHAKKTSLTILEPATGEAIKSLPIPESDIFKTRILDLDNDGTSELISRRIVRWDNGRWWRSDFLTERSWSESDYLYSLKRGTSRPLTVAEAEQINTEAEQIKPASGDESGQYVRRFLQKEFESARGYHLVTAEGHDIDADGRSDYIATYVNDYDSPDRLTIVAISPGQGRELWRREERISRSNDEGIPVQFCNFTGSPVHQVAVSFRSGGVRTLILSCHDGSIQHRLKTDDYVLVANFNGDMCDDLYWYADDDNQIPCMFYISGRPNGILASILDISSGIWRYQGTSAC